ncbi:MAG: O-antigen ligase family protein [Bacteroidetes bacterium]|nr:O-antigen ligase family protein [Bacteroidota bacterium]
MRLKQVSATTIIVGLMAASLPLSYFLFSTSIFLLFLYWLFENNVQSKNSLSSPINISHSLKFIHNLQGKLILFIHNRIAITITSIYFLYLVGSFWSTNIHYIAQELRIKLPFLLLPLLLSGLKPFNRKDFHYILLIYCMAVLASSLVSFFIFLTHPINDSRELSPFMSHIRLSLNVCMALVILYFFLSKEKTPSVTTRIFLFILAFWFIIFLFILKSITGIVLLILLFFALIDNLAWHSRYREIKIASRLFMFSLPLLLVYYALWFNKNYLNIAPVKIHTLEQLTANGNPYWHDTTQFGIECGRYVGLYICEEELKAAWEKRSKRRYTSIDKNGNELRATLIRYLNTKNFRKDAVGLAQLSQEDIRNIENGVANEGLIKPFNLTSRFDNFFMRLHEYQRTGNANGMSELQRIEYYRATYYIIKHHWIMGVGTGDVEDAFSDAYQHLNSKLSNKYRGSSHNQFLYMGVAFGISGILLFIVWLLSLLFYKHAYHDFLFASFFFIMTVSMLTEDTIRNQAGVNFCAFFMGLLLIAQPIKTKLQKYREY